MTGIRIADLPDLGTATDASRMVGDKSGSGTFLFTALKSYIGNAVAPTQVGLLATIAALRLADATMLSPVVFVRGYSANSDGGQGVFQLVPTDTTSADNGGTIIVDAIGRRWYRDWDGTNLEVTWFGGSPSDCSPMLNAALAAVLAAAASLPGAKVIFPARQMTFNTQVTFNYPTAYRTFSLTFEGAGLDATVLYWPTANGLVFNMNKDGHSIHMEDMTIAGGSVNSRNGVLVTQSQSLGVWSESHFERMAFRGIDGGAGGAVWSCSLYLRGVNNYIVDSCNFVGAVLSGFNTGIGVIAEGIASPEVISVIQNFVNCDWIFQRECVRYGDTIQGMTLSQCNMTTCDYGVWQHSGAGLAVIGAELNMNNCQFGTSIAGVLLEGTIANINITGSLFYAGTANSQCFFASATSNVVRYALTGCSFEGNNASGSAGIVINGTDSQLVIAGCTFFAFISAISSTGTLSVGVIQGNTITGLGAVAGHNGIVFGGAESFIAITGNAFLNLDSGVYLTGSTHHCNVQSNTYNAVSVPVVNVGIVNVIGGGST